MRCKNYQNLYKNNFIVMIASYARRMNGENSDIKLFASNIYNRIFFNLRLPPMTSNAKCK